MVEAASAARPWWNLSNNRTISGYDLSLPGVEVAQDCLVSLECYAEEVVQFMLYELDGEMTDARLISLLDKVQHCEYVGDSPIAADGESQTVIQAAVAMVFIDRAVAVLQNGQPFRQILRAWDLMTDACREAHGHWMWALEEDGGRARSQLARKAAIARHSSGPYAEARKVARDCLARWDGQPDLYPSFAAFARDIADKFPELIASAVTVERWVRAWRDE